MNKTTISRRCRPVRVAFCIDPEQPQQLLKAIEISTCTWGGQYNGIIPLHREVPNALAGFFHSSAELMIGYIDALEPDVYVTESPDAELPFSTNGRPRLSFDEYFDSEGLPHVGVGAHVVYHTIYEKEFKFDRRLDAPRFVFPVSTDHSDDLLIATCFGAFPNEGSAREYRSSYLASLKTSEYSIDAESRSLLTTSNIGPLDVGSWFIDVDRSHDNPREPKLFLLDDQNLHDLIEFWNLRALGCDIAAIPVRFADELLNACRDVVTENHVSYRVNPNLFQRTTLLRSRTISFDQASEYGARIAAPPLRSLEVPKACPHIWTPHGRRVGNFQRVKINAGTDVIDIDGHDFRGRTIIPIKAPEFASRQPPVGLMPTFVNVVEVLGGPVGIARVYPPQLQDLGKLLWVGLPGVINSSEGLIFLCSGSQNSVAPLLPDGAALFAHWNEQLGLESKLSDAGRTCVDVMRTFGGPYGARCIAKKPIVELLKKMAHLEIQRSAGRSNLLSEGTLGIAKVDEWLAVLQREYGTADEARRQLKELTERKIIELGLSLECAECDRTNWYSIDSVAKELECRFCLSSYAFPMWNSRSAQWAYRARGPFSIEHHARGGYSVCFATRFLSLAGLGRHSWTPSFTARQEKAEVEFDFGMWCSEDYGRFPPRLLLGECKSWNSFEEIDIERAQSSRQTLKGACLVFATMKPALSPTEKGLLGALARELDGEGRSPLMVLTARELFAEGPPSSGCWSDAPPPFPALAHEVGRYRADRDLVDKLCDATQRAYLDLHSFDERIPAGPVETEA